MFSPQDELEIKNRLSEVVHDVKLLLFVTPPRRIVLLSSGPADEASRETENLMRALAPLSDKLQLEVYDPQASSELAERYGITDVPALVIEGDRDYGIRYLGTPGGYEFASLLEDILSVGKRDSGLAEESRELIRSLTEPLDLKVFVTPG